MPDVVANQKWETLDPEEEVVELPEVSHIPSVIDDTSPLQEVIKDDAKQYNMVLKNICASWKKVKTIDQVCKLALVQTKVLADRRRALNMQLGHESQDTSKKWLTPFNN